MNTGRAFRPLDLDIVGIFIVGAIHRKFPVFKERQ
jgi:hypothetical protein